MQRLARLGDAASKPIIVCNTEHRFLVSEQLKEIDVEATILLEPTGRNTAPAITIAALLAKQEYGPDSVLFIAPLP